MLTCVKNNCKACTSVWQLSIWYVLLILSNLLHVSQFTSSDQRLVVYPNWIASCFALMHVMDGLVLHDCNLRQCGE